MLDVFQLANKTRKQLLDELAAAQTRIVELETTAGGWNRIAPSGSDGETHFARLFREARITNLLFDRSGNLLSANPDALNKLGLLDYEAALRRSLFQSGYWTPEMRAQLASGEVLRVHLALELAATPDEEAAARGAVTGSATPSVAHLESTVSALGDNAYLVQVHDVTTDVQSKAALREREIFFRSVFQAIPYPTAVWKHVGEGKFVLHFYNSSAQEATLGRLAELEGIDLDEFYTHAPDFAARVRESFYTGAPVVAEQTLYVPNHGPGALHADHVGKSRPRVRHRLGD